MRFFPLFLIISLLALSAPANAFEVRGVKVAMSAPDAVRARDAAFIKAQQKALETVARQFLTKEELQNFSAPAASRLSTLVQDFEIIKERTAATKYAGVFNVRFKDAAVRNYFSSTGIYNLPAQFPDFENGIPVEKKEVSLADNLDAAADEQGSVADYLVIPFLKEDMGLRLWDESNIWLSAWKVASENSAMKSAVVPLGDLNDIRDFQNVQSIEEIDTARLQPLLQRYNAKEAVILVGALADKQINISFFNTENVRPIYVRDLTVHQQGQSEADFLADAVDTSQKILQRNWKQVRVPSVIANAAPVFQTGNSAGVAGVPVQALVRFRSLTEWLAIQQMLYTIPSLQQLKITSLRASEADVTLTSTDDIPALQARLAAKGFQLLPQGGSGAYILLSR
ncbi:MAG: hypothetical protein GC136_01165 [Alphaproteobacteria bacterium]|nr:hypothetical protein [Alphaproteobacteria bacterium]